jgi:hypothetical protein
MVVQGAKQMVRTTKQTKTPATPGFAIEITDDTVLRSDASTERLHAKRVTGVQKEVDLGEMLTRSPR